eukprot:m.95133 g.95133  ORF g.95133 m.95133 type:complete len:178 (-) comp10089_c0_seq1:185-718(-)
MTKPSKRTAVDSSVGFGSNQARFPALTSRLAVGHIQKAVDTELLDAKMADGLKTRLQHAEVRAAHPTSQRGTFPVAERTTVDIPKALADDLPGYSFYARAEAESKRAWRRREGQAQFSTVQRIKATASKPTFLPPVGTYNTENGANFKAGYRNTCGTKRAYKATRAAFNATSRRFDL